jgi:glucose-1-phosphate thymidylyltransferase
MLLKCVMLVESEASQQATADSGSKLTALALVANRPIAHHVIDGLREAGVRGIIVAGEADALIDMRASLRDYDPPLDDVEYAVLRAGLGSTSALSAVAPLVGDAPCLIQPADGLLDWPMIGLNFVLGNGSPDLVLFVASPDDNPTRPGEPSSDDDVSAHNGDAIADIGVFGPGALRRAMKWLRRAAGADLAAAGQRLAADGGQVDVLPVDGWHRYRGDGRELLALNRITLDRVAGSIPASARRGNRIEGRVLIDRTATVRSSVITGPAAVGPGATVIDAYLGPYSSIGAGARVEGAEIERSIVGPGASVMHIGGRLVSSLVGRDARIYRDFSLPRALRLWVGEGDQVALC